MAEKCGCHEDTFQNWTVVLLDCIAGLEDEVVCHPSSFALSLQLSLAYS